MDHSLGRGFFLPLLLGVGLVVATSTEGAIEYVDSDPSWVNPMGGNSFPPTTDGETARIEWGSNEGNRSAYVFVDAAPVVLPGDGIDELFVLGTFTHENMPIPPGTGIDGVTLSLLVDLDIDSTPVNDLAFDFIFSHNETPNEGPGNCCDDIVTVTNIVPPDTVFELDGFDYTLTIVGFNPLDGSGDPIVDMMGDLVISEQFITEENAINRANLMAILTRASPEIVPEPGTYLIVATLVGLAALAKGSRKRATN